MALRASSSTGSGKENAPDVTANVGALATTTLAWQLLWHRVVIEADDTEVSEVLGAIAQRAVQDVAPSATLRFEITKTGSSAWSIVGDNGNPATSCTSTADVLDHVFRMTYQRCFDAARHRGWLRIHGALVEVADAVVLLIGDSGAGKTTLALRLGLAGATVQSDETTLVRNGFAMGVPRRFHAKADAPHRIAELHRGTASAAVAGTDVRAVDPAALDIAWRIRPRAVDHVVVLSDVGGPALAQRIGSPEALRCVLAQVLPSGETHGTIARGLSTLFMSTSRWHMTGAGNPDAIGAVRRICESGP